MSFPGADDLLGGPNNPREPDEARGVPLYQSEFVYGEGLDEPHHSWNETRFTKQPTTHRAYPVDEAAVIEDVIVAALAMRETEGIWDNTELEAACQRLRAIRCVP